MPYTVVPTEYGYRITVKGVFAPDEAKQWFEDIKRIVKSRKQFGQFVDIREQKTNPSETTPIVENAMQWVCDNGLQRSSVIVCSPTLRMQIMRLAKEAGMYAYERYFDSSSDPQWEKRATDWVARGVDPDV
ncbi:MAG: hypothetical protein JXA67_22375 [Micromonosporaceae bacterium]|nr:hypothetical protein [Micromonosporaceae bacterium]